MTVPAATPPFAPMSAWQMYRTLVGVGLVCGVLIVSVFESTAPIIRANKIAARERAILDVLPGATTSRTFAMSDDDGFLRGDRGNHSSRAAGVERASRGRAAQPDPGDQELAP